MRTTITASSTPKIPNKVSERFPSKPPLAYPQAWPTHIQRAAMLLILLCRGPGALSLDHWLWRMLARPVAKPRSSDAS